MFDIYLNHSFIISDANDRACEKRRQEAFLSSKRFIPFCKPDGSWSEIQCEHFSKLCWCVDSTGKEVPGTKSRNLKTCPDLGKVRLLNEIMELLVTLSMIKTVLKARFVKQI